MHHCLRVAEIMAMIMQFMVNGSHRKTREVLSLLKTCKLFYEPGLDVLWQDLDYLAPLVMCFPEEQWYIKNKLLVSHPHGTYSKDNF